jgi:hypothetical protein
MAVSKGNANALIKKRDLNGIVFFLLGLLVMLGPRYLFKVCTPGEHSAPICHWSAQAEMGVGALIAALGIGLVVFEDRKICLGLVIGIFLSSIVVLCIPHLLIGGCAMPSMACRKTAFPCITFAGVVLMVYSLGNALFFSGRWKKAEHPLDVRRNKS